MGDELAVTVKSRSRVHTKEDLRKQGIHMCRLPGEAECVVLKDEEESPSPDSAGGTLLRAQIEMTISLQRNSPPYRTINPGLLS
jgi:hypothetical protein